MSHKTGHKRKAKPKKSASSSLGSGTARKAAKAIKGRSAKIKAAMKRAGA